MIDKIINMSMPLFLSVTCGDLLYLYFIGSWYDPIKLIEYTEVIFLFLGGLFGLYWFVISVKKLQP